MGKNHFICWLQLKKCMPSTLQFRLENKLQDCVKLLIQYIFLGFHFIDTQHFVCNESFFRKKQFHGKFLGSFFLSRCRMIPSKNRTLHVEIQCRFTCISYPTQFSISHFYTFVRPSLFRSKYRKKIAPASPPQNRKWKINDVKCKNVVHKLPLWLVCASGCEIFLSSLLLW